MRSHRILPVTAVLAGALALTACSSSKAATPSIGPASVSAATTSSAASATPSSAAQASLAAVQGYWDYKQQALQNPAAYDEKTAQTWVIADAGDALTRTVVSLQQLDQAFRGTPPKARLWLVADASTGAPPTVTVANCPTATGDWLQHDLKSSQAAPAPTVAGQAASPWLTTYAVQDFGGKWLVASSKTDPTKTCTPQ